MRFAMLPRFILTFGVLGCAAKEGTHPASPRTISHAVDAESAFTSALGAMTASGVTVTVADRSSGLIATEWRETDRGSAPLLSCVPFVLIDISESRRFAMQAEVSASTIVVKPRAEVCSAGDCKRTASLSDDEARIVAYVETFTKERLANPNASEPELPVAPAFADKLRPGQRVAIAKRDGEKVTGRFVGYDEQGAILVDRLTVTGSERIVVPAADITKVTPLWE